MKLLLVQIRRYQNGGVAIVEFDRFTDFVALYYVNKKQENSNFKLTKTEKSTKSLKEC